MTPSHTASTPRISLGVNARNEERRLPGMFASAIGMDEIVVVDMASTDRTRDVALAEGARVVELPALGCCELGRQRLLDECRSEWVLVLDADERLSPGAVQQLREVVQSAPEEVAAYQLPFRTYVGGYELRGSGYELPWEYHPRLVRRSSTRWPARVHAVPVFLGRVEHLPPHVEVSIRHENFDSLVHVFEKAVRYASVEADERTSAGVPSSWAEGMREGLGEMRRRYTPSSDSGYSLGVAVAMFAYRVLVHLRAAEMRGDLGTLPLPSEPAFGDALDAFWSTLETRDLERRCHNISELSLSGRPSEALVAIQDGIATWGEAPALLLAAAGVAARTGMFDQAVALTEHVLARESAHSEAQRARFSFAVMRGERPAPSHLACGASLAVQEGEELVVGEGEQGGLFSATPETLPVALGSLVRLRVSRTFLAQRGRDIDASIGTMLRYLAPDGELCLVD